MASFILKWLGKGVEYGTTIFRTGVSFVKAYLHYIRHFNITEIRVTYSITLNTVLLFRKIREYFIRRSDIVV